MSVNSSEPDREDQIVYPICGQAKEERTTFRMASWSQIFGC